MLPMQLSFRKLLGERFASSGFLCPLRSRVNNYIQLKFAFLLNQTINLHQILN